MGPAPSCTACCSDTKADLEIRCSLPYTPHVEFPDISAHESTDDLQLSSSSSEESAALTILTFWKGYIVRKLISRIVKTSRSQYFPRAEVLETLSKSPLPSSRETKNPRRYKSGAVYKGQWLGGFRDGLGTMSWPDGAEYAGSWHLGYPYGDGKFTTPDGDCYQGKWGSIFAQGQKSLCKTGEGWQDSVKDGFEWLWYKEEVQGTPPIDIQKLSVIEALKDISKKIDLIRSELNIQADHFQGHEIRDGDAVFTGQMQDHKKYGYGKLTYENGDTYFGQWKANLQHGYGHNLWADGSEFVGQYNADDKEGVGEYQWEDGTKYIGDWSQNLMHGYGKYTWPDGRKYEGEWRSGLMQGFGVYCYSDGKRYEGGWFKGKKHGIGITYLANGTSSKGVWSLGKLTRT
mmetsp:Transcript_9233/g.17563  ORF Transcript_9233/g.17563 Transcript_9233/m.17563 type:complete len:402 (+) Transcript_9233:679-1884(+)